MSIDLLIIVGTSLLSFAATLITVAYITGLHGGQGPIEEGSLTYFRQPNGTTTDGRGNLRPEPPTHCPICRRALKFHTWGVSFIDIQYPTWRCDGLAGTLPVIRRLTKSATRGRHYTFNMPPLKAGVEEIIDFHPRRRSEPPIEVYGRSKSDILAQTRQIPK